MSHSLLFAIDKENQEVVISTSNDGSKKIENKDSIKKSENISLFNAVITLKSLTESDDLDIKVFKAMQKVCEMIYKNHKG